jgi:hypothetical protein
MKPKAPIGSAKPGKVTDRPNPGLTFMTKLRGTGPFALRRVANALHAATGERQEELLQRLRKGQLVASTYWPGQSDLVELPTALWQAMDPRRFKVRTKVEGRWRTYDYAIPAAQVIKHVVIPRLRTICVPTNEQQRGELIDLLNTDRDKAGVVVTVTNAKLFADDHLGPIFDRERRGRPKTNDAERLLIEIFRRLHSPTHQLPKQEAFILFLTDWWNDDPKRPERSQSWVRNYVQLVWAALKHAPKA